MPSNDTSLPDESTIDIAAMAAMEFQPWDKDGHGNPAMIKLHAPNHLNNASAAFNVLCLTKGQLVDLMRTEPEAFRNIHDCIEESAQAFKTMGGMLDGAAMRMLCATAVILQEQAA